MSDVLVLGGGVFLGKHVSAVLRKRGHAVTHFNRGKSGGPPPAGVMTVRGDRRSDLAALETGTWDAVVDTSGYAPRDVEIATRFFAGRTRRYLFVSTISVYDAARSPLDEDSPTLPLPDAANRTLVTPETYGALKAACETVVVSTFRERATVLRPGLIVGPDDPTDRFTAWPVRFATGGDILVPESPAFHTQFVDVRDLSEFMVRCIERGLGGTYNVTSPRGMHALGSVFAACADVARVSARLHWASPTFLENHGIEAWSDMPLWIPKSAGLPGMLSVDVRRALVTGLAFRPIRETARDTLHWAQTRPRGYAMRAGLTAQREAAALAVLR